MLPQELAYLSIFITLVGISFYIRDIFRGTTKPNFVTWFFWMLAPFIGTFLQIKAGAGLSALPVFMAGFAPLLVLIAASVKKRAYWNVTYFDIGCGVFSFVALVLWIWTRNTSVAILFAILSDAIAAIPTLIKSWNFPETETGLGYLPGVLGNIIGLLVISEWTFSIYSFGIYFILLNSTLLLFIYRKRFFKV